MGLLRKRQRKSYAPATGRLVPAGPLPAMRPLRAGYEPVRATVDAQRSARVALAMPFFFLRLLPGYASTHRNTAASQRMSRRASQHIPFIPHDTSHTFGISTKVGNSTNYWWECISGNSTNIGGIPPILMELCFHGICKGWGFHQFLDVNFCASR